MRIKGFWHICMVNNYRSIITEQMQMLVDSELYRESEEISVGLVGSIEELPFVASLIKPYDKIKVKYHSFDMDDYEFKTLNIFYRQSIEEEEFYGYYIHTKGCSFPNHKGGEHWRDYMNHYIITQWDQNVKNLVKGYDLSGVKLLNKQCPPVYIIHYSGNFFWFNSTYIKRLPNIFEYKISDRFQAEFWVGGANPKAASLCQRMIDYSNTDKFTPGRILVHTLSYNTTDEMAEATRLLYEKNNNQDFTHTIVDLGFPLEHGNVFPKSIDESVSNNTKTLKSMCDEYGSEYVRLKNVGVSQNWSAIVSHFKPTDNDIVIGADPDERVYEEDWVNAIANVLRCNDKIGVVSLMIPDHEAILTPDKYKEVFIGGERVWFIKGNLNWGLIGISGRFLNLIGEIPYPKNAPIYGWLEDELIKLLNKHEMKWVVLPDYKEHHTENNPIYRLWKNYCVHHVSKGQKDFTDWLKEQNK